jgi:hypothetical protein
MEIGGIPDAHIWITGAKEIENYLPGSVLDKVFSQQNTPSPERYARFFPSGSHDSRDLSFVEEHLKRKGVDKVELAIAAVKHMTKTVMESRFDLAEEVVAIIKIIRRWNE